jgi:hypothetical protein
VSGSSTLFCPLNGVQPTAGLVSQATDIDNDPLLSKVDLAFSVILYPLGFAVEIRSNEHAVIAAAMESWGGLPSQHNTPPMLLKITVTEVSSLECPPAPKTRAQGHLISIVADADNQVVCDLKAGFAFGCVSQAVLHHRSYLRYYFIEAAAYLMIGGLYVTPIHAACVSKSGHGLLLCGDSGAGKSTLAYACARAGWTYTTDDASYLLRADHVPRIIGNSHQVRFRPSARELFPELAGRGITPRAEGKPSIEVPTVEFPGLITSAEASIHSIVFLNRHPSSIAELVPLSRDAALDHFSATLYPVKEIRDLQVSALASLEDVDVFELRYGDLSPAIHCLEGLVELTGMIGSQGPGEDACV